MGRSVTERVSRHSAEHVDTATCYDFTQKKYENRTYEWSVQFKRTLLIAHATIAKYKLSET